MYEINRSVVVVFPLEPFWNWLQSLPENPFQDYELEDLQADANSYLINPCDSPDEVWEEVEAHFEEIFAAELSDWCEDKALWPEIDSETFSDWFDVQISTLASDLSNHPLEREAFQPLNIN